MQINKTARTNICKYVNMWIKYYYYIIAIIIIIIVH